MKFAIRDDDTSWETKPEELERLWGPVIGYAPVSLAVTPFAVRAHFRGDPGKFYQEETPNPLGANPELVDWLRSRLSDNSITVMCHGCTHQYQRLSPAKLLPEYVWKTPERLRLETQRAKKHLEESLGRRVATFVPPGNGISRPALEAVRPYFTNVLATFPLRRIQDFRLEREYVFNYLRRLFYQVRHGSANPFGETVHGVRLIPSVSLTQQANWDDIRGKLDLCRRLNADFVAAVHYWEMDERLRGVLHRLLDLAAQWSFDFRHCDDLFATTNATRLEFRHVDA